MRLRESSVNCDRLLSDASIPSLEEIPASTMASLEASSVDKASVFPASWAM
jgi:hypothetical protein